MCMDVLPVIMSVHHMCAVPVEKRSDALVLMIVSHHVDAGNQTQVFWKSSQCS